MRFQSTALMALQEAAVAILIIQFSIETLLKGAVERGIGIVVPFVISKQSHFIVFYT